MCSRRSSTRIGEPDGGQRPSLALAEVAVVEGIEALAGQRLERVRERRQAHTLAGQPRRGACGRYTAAKPASGPGWSASSREVASTLSMNSSQAGNPSRASSMAGASTWSGVSRPNRLWASPQDRTAPGTVIVSGPRRGIVVSAALAQGRGIDRRGRSGPTR